MHVNQYLQRPSPSVDHSGLASRNSSSFYDEMRHLALHVPLHCLIPLLALLSVAVTGSSLLPRQCVDTCGSTCYYQSDIDAAVNQGCNYYQQGQTVGTGKYPHAYNDYEGISFPDSGPYLEFPILRSYRVYTGGSPGADRVIFDENCAYEGVITHTGASGNDFLQCMAD